LRSAADSARVAPSLAWLVAGGIAYTGFSFVSKRNRFTHFVWHFSFSSTTCHFFAIFSAPYENFA
jgi:hypothetical protein